MCWQPAYIGLGANIGDPESQLLNAWDKVASLDGCRYARLSGLYQSVPMDAQEQPDYINAVGALLTTLEASQLLDQMLDIERQLGRKRDGKRWAPRVIDLDLLVFGEQVIDQSGLRVPHPGVHERNFVLYPLAEIAPDLHIPGRGQVSRLMALVGDRGLERISQS